MHREPFDALLESRLMTRRLGELHTVLFCWNVGNMIPLSTCSDGFLVLGAATAPRMSTDR
ncbi:hypothetical protein CC86DRAFT_87159 [Ophiobolus disseminans]|uniref:Uncharacterized protein n=1 Tax=Ophiobolus disseminans TaxID=1469910 RepID=A0A6A7AFU4_9PLEO|nr:hypothetical protein CC86DRAFT_87159 [Ophiobolus disseminans]